MKKLLILLFLFSCAKKGTSVKVDNNLDDFSVTLLFEYEGYKVVRFYDDGGYKYFSTCNGTVNYTETYQCGRSRCSRNESIQTN